MLCKSALVTIAAAFTLLFSACQKDDDTNTETSGQEILTSGQWMVTAATANPPVTIGGIPFSNLYLVAPTCLKDNYYVFKTDGIAELNEGATKCNPTDPQTLSQTWSLSSDEKSITINTTQYTVLELTQTRFRVSGSYAYPGVGSIPAELTFTKQ